MRVTKTIREYVEKQLDERSNAILAPWKKEANDVWERFKEEADTIVKEAEKLAIEQLNILASRYVIKDYDNEPVKAIGLEIRSYAFNNLCNNRLPENMIYRKKRDEVNQNLKKQKEELLISLELGEIDKKSLLAAIADIKLEG